ncbi:hypothetical protein ACH0CI_15815 [Priestia sp. 179-F W1.4 NHS]|uniref:hypothetical protein n=1 Tax=Priestia sp. 179-F W1.4 NHS TaxID=3374296 RepID=UPI00387A5282
MAVTDWLELENFKKKLNELDPSLQIDLKPPTTDHSSKFKLEGYRTRITSHKFPDEMGNLDAMEFLSYPSAHKNFTDIYDNVLNKENLLSNIESTWNFPSLYFITVYKDFEDGEESDDYIIKFLGDEIRDEKLYNICRKGNDILRVEKLLYIGRTYDIVNRFRDGHKVTQALSHSKYNEVKKRIYIAEIDIFDIFEFTPSLPDNRIRKILEFIPIESISNRELVIDIQIFLERYFISYFKVPFYNLKDKTPKVDFKKWPMVSEPKLITINDYPDSCFFEDVTPSLSNIIDAILEEPRNLYNQSMKHIETKRKSFSKENKTSKTNHKK